MGNPSAVARQLDRCDICGKKTHKTDLVRTNVDFLAAGGSNYIPYSTYNSDYWTVQYGTDAGTISCGPFCDEARVSIADDNTTTEINGTQTWTVQAGVLSAYEGFFKMYTGEIDVSSWDSLVFSFDFGFYHADTSDRKIMVYSYIHDADGNTSGVIRRFQGHYSSGRYWWYINTADIDPSVNLSTAIFYTLIGTYAGGEKVWVDRIQLEKNATQMGAFVPTSGSAIDRVDTRMMTVRKVCPSCKEPLLSRTEQYNKKPEQRTDSPIAVDIQEI